MADQCDIPLALNVVTLAKDAANPIEPYPESPEETAVVTPTLCMTTVSPRANPAVEAIADWVAF